MAESFTLTNRSRPNWALVTAALIGLPVLYLASFGPWLWLCQTERVPAQLRWIDRAYSPVILPILVVCPEWMQEPYTAYVNWWLDDERV